MVRFVLPKDMTKLIIDTAWGNDAPSVIEFGRELEYLEAFHDHVPAGLLQPTFYDTDIGYTVSSPFRRHNPYVPLKRLRFTNVWDSYLVKQFANAFSSETLRSVKTYRGILERRTRTLMGTPCSHSGWNEYVRTFSRFKNTDLKPYTKLLYDAALRGFQNGTYSEFPKDLVIPAQEARFFRSSNAAWAQHNQMA